MNAFVLDNSVSMRWLLESDKAADQTYASLVLESLASTDARVPNLWHLEVCSVLLGAEKRLEVNLGEIEHFLSQLEALPIHVDSLTSRQALSHTLLLAREYKLSSYDAAYLELALREGLPLASLDKQLLKAAERAGVAIYLR